MLFLDSVADRHRRPEIMDQPGLDRELLYNALAGLERINRWSRSTDILWPAIKAVARTAGTSPVTLLDVATGAGDIPIGIWHRAQRAGLALCLAGCDQSPQTVEYARRRAIQAGADVCFFEQDVIAGGIPGEYDIVTSSLFLHHLDEKRAIELLGRMAGAARRLVLVNDLVRGRTGFLLAWLGARLLTSSKVVHVDAPRSVEGAFTPIEARSLADHAGLTGATVRRKWPCRFLLSWERPLG
jgi:hypothetical protein